MVVGRCSFRVRVTVNYNYNYNRCIHSKIYYYHTLAEAKEKQIVELYLLPDFPPVSGEGGSRIEDSAVLDLTIYTAGM